MKIKNNYNKAMGCAIRVSLSPHEWTWTQEEQIEMAKAILNYDTDIKKISHIARQIIEDSNIWPKNILEYR